MLCTIEVLINSFEREKNKGNDLQMVSMLKNMKEEMITHYINGEETYAEGCNRRKR